jgi:hypothetical protein
MVFGYFINIELHLASLDDLETFYENLLSYSISFLNSKTKS